MGVDLIKGTGDVKPGFTLQYLLCKIQESFWPKVVLGFLLSIPMSLDDFLSNCHKYYHYNIFGTVFGSMLIWTGSSFIGGFIDNKFDWETQGLKKSIYLVVINVVFITFTIGIEMYVIGLIKGDPVPAKYYLNSFILCILITTIINLIFISRGIFDFWKHTKYENEVLKQENLRSQLESLKNQVNPHFLFNSLNTLISIIDDEPEIAKNYTQNLSQVYRYILQAKEKDLVSLREEIDFTKAYNYLLKIRYGNNLRFDVSIPDKYLQYQVPTLVLQMLVENAIKHNVISEARPLKISITMNGNDNMIVSNNYQPKKLNVESDKVGLKNISDRFRILDNKEIQVIQNDTDFIVKLPLIM